MALGIHGALDALRDVLAAELPNLDHTALDALVEAVADNIETFRADQVAEMVALITAANQNTLNVQSTLANLKLCCTSTTVISPPNFFQAIIEPSGPGGPAIPPPDPFTDLPYAEDEEQNRRCVIATYMVDEMRETFNTANEWQMDEILNIEFVALFGIWIALLAEVAAAAPVLAAIYSTVTVLLPTIVKHMLDNLGSLEFSTIVTAFDARREDLICALFEGVDGSGARSDFVAILAAEGVTVPNQVMVALMLADHYVNPMFYFLNPANEAFYLSGEAIGDCTSCSVSCANRTPSTMISDNGTTYVIQADQINPGDAAYYAIVHLDATPQYQYCGNTYTIDNVAITAGALNPLPPAGVRFYDNAGGAGTSGNRYHSNVLPTIPITGVRQLVFKSSTPVTVTFDYVVE